ncbi:hypothetical protein [Sphingomonas sp. 1P08PE]|uniref:hypothetical protein n=1 Tax=Sphingomonas sp. 1P08PE TaxID=554122 RepID=UPI0039A194F4
MMNLKGLSPEVRALVEAVMEPAAEEHYELVEADEDGDTVTLTFSRDLGLEADTVDDEDDD